MDLINQINVGSNFMRPIEPINRHIQTQSKLLQYTHTKIKRFLAKKGVLSGGALSFGLLYSGGDKSEKVCTDYKV